MRIEVDKITDWNRAFNSAVFTVHKDVTKEPSDKWKKSMLLAEHSPIRDVEFDIKIYDIPYYVAMHLVRHHVGVTPYVSTQRSDRTGEPRNKKPQDAPVMLKLSANAQALISMSRKRLCSKADAETRKVWTEVVSAIELVDPVLAECLVPECVYRGFCPEKDGCKFIDSSVGSVAMERYRVVK